ncbi:MAG: biotin--[acetyl-CoA-carboxylase] ligase [Flavobacteriaceae bacterium]
MSKFNIIKLDATASTNDWLKDEFLSGNCSDRDVLWVKNQTQGRGQRNKTWESDPGKNLTFSLFKEFANLGARHSFLINCAVTLSIVKALDEVTNIDLRLKWPNDILSGKKKIGGVLIENMVKGERIVNSIIGIGINVNQKQFFALPHASSLLLQSGKKFDIADLLEKILKFLDLNLEIVSQNRGQELLEQYESLLFQKGEGINFRHQSEKFKGIIMGVTENGLLRVQKTSGMVCNFSHGSIEMLY